jgi:hypothetical protein
LRVYAETASNQVSAVLTKTNINANGNGLIWDDWEVVDVLVITNRRPGGTNFVASP